MSNKVSNITIVGGGTAGWMTASYLNKVFGQNVDITLVESPNISTVGVGEATFSTIKLFFDFLELEEHDWMPHCNGSYKMAIKFVDWNAEKKHFYHPFQRYEIVDGFHIGEWWLKHKDQLDAFDYSSFMVSALCDNKRAPRFLDGRVFDTKVQDLFTPDRAFKKNMLADLKIQYPYAYHFNAALLANFLRELAIGKGVRHIADDVVGVSQAENGFISGITTKEHGEIEGDLFIDCTGFKGMLINKVLNEQFIPFAESLLCDTALAMQVPRDIEKDGMNPFTSATALSSGWVWNIPLYGRDGTGYVFSSAFITPEEAEKEFRKHVGKASDNCNASLIKMRIGRNHNAWVKNCVAIGLANAFVEPLESTGIFFIQQGIEELVANFPDKQCSPELQKRYNKTIGECIDGVRDFLTLHYCASSRYDTPFWKATKHDLKLSDDLKERQAEWKVRLPNPRNINPNYHGFESYSYAVMLQGLGYSPENCLPVLQHMDSTRALEAFRRIRERTNELIRTLPSQYEYLTSVRVGQNAGVM
ncbi:tryptophan halogenase family protein [Chitinophaga flava]|uniref:Tryptophan halogenase n=1 Tax=Chitinophaga flava TaxID=2259036 RepID=A0A365XW80_9BACT|nr:tryptophan halogenase family protein [Chitinophaga flava]RBL89964.1 tryptophan halogenase [Chitinophaga flava]